MSGGITLHFHPDWPTRDGRLVIEAIAADGVYRSQWETGMSNGGLTAHPGGDRWHWESRLFNGRYDDGPPDRRPVYGSFDRRGDDYGGSPRFGSAYLRLRPEAVAEATFCYPDSVFEPTDVGGAGALSRLITLADAATGEVEPLDDYIEAQVHRRVRLPHDIEEVVLDPVHLTGPAAQLVSDLGCPVRAHGGYRLNPDDVPPLRFGDYRGPEPAALARGLAARSAAGLTPDLVAAAARSGDHDPQVVKRVWHLLARFGRQGTMSP